jgi:hypothetical protein
MMVEAPFPIRTVHILSRIPEHGLNQNVMTRKILARIYTATGRVNAIFNNLQQMNWNAVIRLGGHSVFSVL